VFRLKRSRKSSVPVIYWGEDQIEIVDKYTYLGVTFYHNLNYKETCSDILRKAKVAEKNLFSVFYRAKIKTFSSRYKLFDTLVKSILMYCSSIWGTNQVNTFNVFQNKFLRKLFCLPNKTPNWFLRLETHSISLEVTYINRLLKFWLRILRHPSNSLVKDCYLALKSCAHKTTVKYNWYRDLESLLDKWDCRHLLELADGISDECDLGMFSCYLKSSLQSLSEKAVSSDIVRMNNSTSMPRYRDLRTHYAFDPFLDYMCHWSKTRAFVQLRANLAQISTENHTTKLQSLCNFYDGSISSFCKCCDLQKQENLLHLLFECPRYNLLRSKYLSNYCYASNECNYYQLLVDATPEKLNAIYTFVKFAIITRNLVMGIPT
jgi:hypothetical protein